MSDWKLTRLADNPLSQNPLHRCLIYIRAVLLSVMIFLPLIILNFIQMLALPIRLLSIKAFRKFNWFLADRYWSYLAFMVESVNKIEITFTGEKLPPHENALIIANHQSMADIPILLSMGHRYQRLGDFKWFIKDIFKYIPGPGWGTLFLDCIFLKRDWLSDRENIAATFHSLIQYRVPFWVVSFLEGTRLTAAKLEQSKAFAKERGMLETEHLMIPRTKGFVASVIGLKSEMHAVYSVTLAYSGGIPTLWQMILGDFKKIAVDVARTPLAELPQSEKGLDEWALAAYRLKDSKLKHFYETGVFPGKPSLLTEQASNRT